MRAFTAEILELTKEAAVLLEKNRIAYANQDAKNRLGADCIGKTVEAVFGEEIAQMQASGFVGGMLINGTMCTVRVSKSEAAQLIMFAPMKKSAALMNDAFLYQLNESISVLGLGLERARNRAEQGGDAVMLENLRSMTRTYFRMLRLAKNALVMKGITEKNLNCSMMPVNVSGLCREIAAAVQMLFPNLEIRQSLSRDMFVNADIELLSQLIFNLISNALRHGECDRISMSVHETRESVFIAVDDNGKGMDSAGLKSVFDSFNGEFGVNNLGKGSGFGMSVCAGVAEIHGGAVLVESRPGQGTLVRASLSKKTPGGTPDTMYSSDKAALELKNVLINLAECAPLEFFGELYMD